MMHRTIRAVASSALLACLLLACGNATGSDRPDLSSVRGTSPFTWNQEELILGFANWDALMRGHEVSVSDEVKELPLGEPLAVYTKGGDKEEELEQFFSEQKVAGLIVLQNGKVRLERYGLGQTPDGRWTSQSVAKSVTSTLLGAAIKDGSINSLDDLVVIYLPGLLGSGYQNVTIRQLLTMTSGVAWNESYVDPNSDVARIHHGPLIKGLNSTVSYMRGLESEAPPGTRFQYSTGESHLLGVLVSKATGKPLADYLAEKVWGPYGMEQSADWTLDRTGTELGGCCLQATLRDYARFGQFVLDEGHINGESVVPEGWFEEAITTQVETGLPRVNYGYQWWIIDDKEAQAVGIHGQLIHIDPERQLVVAVNSAWPESWNPARVSAQGKMLRALVAAIDEEGDSGD